jgi:hypothetical protein
MQGEYLLHLTIGEPNIWPSDPKEYPYHLEFFITKGTSFQHVHIVSIINLTREYTPIIRTKDSTMIHKALNNHNTTVTQIRDYSKKILKTIWGCKTERGFNEATNDLITTM